VVNSNNSSKLHIVQLCITVKAFKFLKFPLISIDFRNRLAYSLTTIAVNNKSWSKMNRDEF